MGLTDTSSYYVTNVTTNTLQLTRDSYHKAMMNIPQPLTITDGAGAFTHVDS